MLTSRFPSQFIKRTLTRTMADQQHATNLSAEELLERFNRIKHQVEQVANGRQVQLVAVSKRKPASDILTIHRSTGHEHFGENYVNELQEKAEQLPQEIKWHFIGALQTNKCKILGAIPNLFAVETVDSFHKAELLEKARDRLSSATTTTTTTTQGLEIYLQVNTSREDSKAGFQLPPDNDSTIITTTELFRTAKYVLEQCRWLKMVGLMTIGSISESTSSSNHTFNHDFDTLNKLKDQLQRSLSSNVNLKLSMGMSADFPLAIQMGSDNVRVGSIIFGQRPPLKKP